MGLAEDSAAEAARYGDLPVARYDLTADCYPIRTMMFNQLGREVWSSVTTFADVKDGPTMLEIPPLAQMYGPVDTVIEFGNGELFASPASDLRRN